MGRSAISVAGTGGCLQTGFACGSGTLIGAYPSILGPYTTPGGRGRLQGECAPSRGVGTTQWVRVGLPRSWASEQVKF